MYRAATLAALAVLASACTTMDAEGDTMQTDTAMVSPILTTPEAVDAVVKNFKGPKAQREIVARLAADRKASIPAAPGK